MMDDKQQTKALRLARVQEKRTIKELNNTGKRLEWVRLKLEIPQRAVCLATGIPPSSLCGREANIRAEIFEEYLVLAKFYDELWKKKFNGNYPIFSGSEVKKITVEWLMFGHSDIEENAEHIINEYKMHIRDLEINFYNREAEILKQLEMFSKEQV